MTRTDRRTILLCGAALLVISRETGAQRPDSGPVWTLTGGVVTFRVSDVNGWGVGPSAGAHRRVHGRLRLDINAAALLSSSGFYNFTGLTLDLGPAIALTQGRIDATLGVGASAVVGGDSDGTGGGCTTGRTSPSLAAGLALRL